MSQPERKSIGNRLAPARFLLFLVLLVAGVPAAGYWLQDWRLGIMAGFDVAALVFLFSCLSLLKVTSSTEMRDDAARNDANRAMLLVITGAVMLALLATVAAEVTGGGAIPDKIKAIIIATLLLAWLFSNTVYALHYAHLAHVGGSRGLAFPETDAPAYSDFAYFAFTLGMTFQTSDVAITDRAIRRAVTLHCLAAFVFNIGVLAFTINVLGR